MPSVPIHVAPHILNAPTSADDRTTALQDQTTHPLPPVLRTPTGLAIVEIQGTINLPYQPNEDQQTSTEVGQLVFPSYDVNDTSGDTAWMKVVHLYVGQHQRLTGEIKKLPKPLALLRKRPDSEVEALQDPAQEELDLVEVVEWKILFSSRPEPVSV